MAGEGLRERKRRTAMDHIQRIDLDLFDAEGYEAVTIEQIAEASEVSPSSVYRYFGTKEGLVISDSDDEAVHAAIASFTDLDALIAQVRAACVHLETRDDPGSRSWRRMGYYFSEPSVRATGYLVMDELCGQLAENLVARHGLGRTQAHVWSHAAVFGFIAAYEQWYLDGGTRPLIEHVDEALALLKLLPIAPTKN